MHAGKVGMPNAYRVGYLVVQHRPVRRVTALYTLYSESTCVFLANIIAPFKRFQSEPLKGRQTFQLAQCAFHQSLIHVTIPRFDRHTPADG